MNNIFTEGWGLDWPLGKFAYKLMQIIEQQYDNCVVIDTTWLGSDNLPNAYELVEAIEPQTIILCSFVDAPFVYSKDFEQFGIPIVSIGNYNTGTRIDFWSMVMFNKFRAPYTTPKNITYPFLCYNNKPHPHRIKLKNELQKYDLINKGAVSFHGLSNSIISPEDQTVIQKEDSGSGGSVINDTMTLGDIRIWNSSFLNVVTETEWNPVKRCFYSEKIYKPILGMRPFLVYAEQPVYEELNAFGFVTFENCFKDISDLDLTDYKNLVPFLQTLCEQDELYFNKKYKQLDSMLKHNWVNFFKYARKQYDTIKDLHN